MGVKTPIHTQTRTDTHTHTRTCAQYCVTHFKHVQEHQCTHTHTHTRVFTLRQCIVRPPTQSCSCANSTHTHVHTLWVHAESLCVSLHAHIGVCLFLYVCVCMCVYLCDCIYVLQAYVCKFECIMFLNICVSTCLVCQCVSVCVLTVKHWTGRKKQKASCLLSGAHSLPLFPVMFFIAFFVPDTSVSSPSASTMQRWMDVMINNAIVHNSLIIGHWFRCILF